MNETSQLKRSAMCPRERLTKIRSFRNVLLAATVLFALPSFIYAGTGDRVLNLSRSPFLLPQPTIITFDAPGAGTGGPFQGTLVVQINPAGVITGGYFDANEVEHVYLRATDGTFTTYDAPGAGTGPFQGTGPNCINPPGATAGNWSDPSNVGHAYVRAPDGTIMSFDAPGAGPQFGTISMGINPAGVIAGEYADASVAFHGFVRDSNGTIPTFDAAGAGTGFFQGTSMNSAGCINPAGVIVGGVTDASNLTHGFVRDANGTITTFDVQGAGTGPGQGTEANGINPAGTIAGVFVDSSNVLHGFVRDANGTITTFDVPEAGTGPGQGTEPYTINPAGAIAGWYIDVSNVNHSFVRAANGTITTFDAPGAGTGPGQGSVPFSVAINPAGAIAGAYSDSSNVIHGFLRTP